jgi:ABC-type branched-subunit amino acid transport system substrate-binding protein
MLAVSLVAAGCGSRESGPDIVGAPAPAPNVGTAVPTAPAPAPEAATDTAAVPAPAQAATTPKTSGSTTAASQDQTTHASSSKDNTATKTTEAKTTTKSAAAGSAPVGSTTSGSTAVGNATTGSTPVGKTYSYDKTDQGVSATEIKLGIVAPLSGAAGFLGEAEVAGIRAYTSMINAQGGVKGRKYTLAIRDSQFRPDVELQAARQLVDGDKVFALFSVLGDSTGPYVTQKNIPTLVFGVVPPAFSSKYKSTHVTGFSAMDLVVRMAYSLNVIQKKAIKSTAILYDTQNMNLGPWVKYLVKGWEATGAKVASTDAFNISDADCTAMVAKMQNLKIDFWQAGQSLAWPACLAAMARAHYRPRVGAGGPYTADNKYVAQGGTGADGVFGEQVGVQVVTNPGQPYPYDGGPASTVAPAYKDYIASIQKYAPRSADTDTLESVWTQVFWVGAQALTKGIEAQTKGISFEGVNAWFHDQKHYKSGLTAPINFDPNCKTGSAAWLFQWKLNSAGKLVQTSWKDQGGPFTMPDSFLDKIVPGAGQCYMTKAADNEM